MHEYYSMSTELLDALSLAAWRVTRYVSVYHAEDYRKAFDALLRKLASCGPFLTRAAYEPEDDSSPLANVCYELHAQCCGVSQYVADILYKHENHYGNGFDADHVCAALMAVLDLPQYTSVLEKHYGLHIPPRTDSEDDSSFDN